ncbi:uncharacterized protein [Halyomorpha halys]|uniref:uncharacterized protein n=1 Tax=Halyomorpha halys TaxID=286706 RepID=UPI0006D506E6|nr:uncharacterized protein LOC106680173 [Halyomorpha halys]
MSQLKIQRFDITEFLEEYQKFPCLWRKCDPDYKIRAKRDEAERFLLHSFNFGSITELRQKIRSIRGTYNQERNKVRNSLRTGMGRIFKYKPKLIWFDVADSFLKQNEEENGYDSNMVTEEEDCLTEMEREEESTSPEQHQSDQSTLNLILGSNSVQHPTSKSEQTTSQSPKQMHFINQKRKREKGGPQNQKKIAKLDDPLHNAVNVLKKVASRLPSTNEFIIFGNHVASQLQRLPLAEALQLQAEIHSLITSARVQNLQNSSSVINEQLTTNYSTSQDSSHHQNAEPRVNGDNFLSS